MLKLIASVVMVSSFQAKGASVPVIQYVTTAGTENRKLIFVNNPEEIRAEAKFCDLADEGSIGGSARCAKVLHRLNQVSGNFRNWYEHTNKTSSNINYGVRIYNPGPGCVDIAVKGKGSVTNAVFLAGKEFVDLFSKPKPFSTRICATEQTYISLVQNIPPRNFFAGVVDFNVIGGDVVIDNLAYAARPAPSTAYMGYDRRVVGGVHESLVYKGISPHSEAVASQVDFTFGDQDPDGILKVAYKFFKPFASAPAEISNAGRCETGKNPPCFGSAGIFEDQPTVVDNWVTHIVVDPFDRNPRRTRAVQTDNVTLYMPGYGSGCLGKGFEVSGCLPITSEFLHYYPDFSRWLYPNWANWGVVYRVKGLLKNQGQNSRVFNLSIRPDGHTAIAYRASDGIWRQARLEKIEYENRSFTYFSKVLGPGETYSYEAMLVLSGPASGTLENRAFLSGKQVISSDSNKSL
jgi:hypothetical protein